MMTHRKFQQQERFSPCQPRWIAQADDRASTAFADGSSPLVTQHNCSHVYRSNFSGM